MFAAEPFPWFVFGDIHFTFTSLVRDVFGFAKTRASIIICMNELLKIGYVYIFQHFEEGRWIKTFT